MSEAPEQIWAFAPDIFDNYSLWQDMPSPAGDTIEYIRADHVDALLKAEREKVLREAAGLNGWWLGINPAGEPDGTFCSVPPHDDPQAEKYVRVSRILALIENPAG